MTLTTYLGFEIETHGDVLDKYVLAAAHAANETFEILGFRGKKPKIEIGTDYVIISGAGSASAYEPEKNKIDLGIKGIQRKKSKRVSLEVAVAAFSAHEAAHHFMKESGVYLTEIELEDPKDYEKVAENDLETSPNAIAKRVIENIYGIKIAFTKEAGVRK